LNDTGLSIAARIILGQPSRGFQPIDMNVDWACGPLPQARCDHLSARPSSYFWPLLRASRPGLSFGSNIFPGSPFGCMV